MKYYPLLNTLIITQLMIRVFFYVFYCKNMSFVAKIRCLSHISKLEKLFGIIKKGKGGR